MPKNARHGQAHIWTDEQWQQVSAELLPHMRALFSICYYTGCRVSEARKLRASDLTEGAIVFRKSTTKTQKTRTVPIHSKLAEVLEQVDLPEQGLLFPSPRNAERPISRQAADKALRKACDFLGFKGFSTHSNRRSMATTLHNKGIPLRVIQEIGGWTDLKALQRYLEVSPEQVERAISQL